MVERDQAVDGREAALRVNWISVMVEQLRNPDEMNIVVSIVEDDAPARGILADWIQRAPGFR